MIRHYVVVKKIESDKKIKRIGPCSLRTAEQVERGVNININASEFYTDIIEVEEV